MKYQKTYDEIGCWKPTEIQSVTWKQADRVLGQNRHSYATMCYEHGVSSGKHYLRHFSFRVSFWNGKVSERINVRKRIKS